MSKKALSVFYTQWQNQRFILRPNFWTAEHFFHNQRQIYTQIIGQENLFLKRESLSIKTFFLNREKLYSEHSPKPKKFYLEQAKTKTNKKYNFRKMKFFHFAHKTFLKKMFLMAWKHVVFLTIWKELLTIWKHIVFLIIYILII